MKHIKKCLSCGKYTLQKDCCGKETIQPKPPKFSPEDKYATYRRKAKAPSVSTTLSLAPGEHHDCK